jgi:hypothetical protein
MGLCVYVYMCVYIYIYIEHVFENVSKVWKYFFLDSFEKVVSKALST